MLEIEYIPLKTPDGKTCGHACVRRGSIELKLREKLGGSVLVLCESGTVDAAPVGRTPLSSPVNAVALHENGRLRAAGFSKDTALDHAALRRRLQALRPAREPEQKAERRAAFVEAIAAGIPDITPKAPAPEAPRKQPAQEAHRRQPAQEAPDAASREAMAARAARVFHRIETPAPPLTAAEPAISAPADAHTPAADSRSRNVEDWSRDADAHTPAADSRSRNVEDRSRDADAYTPAADSRSRNVEDWSRDADALLVPDATAAPATQADIPNPFPHIFPGACFTQLAEGELLGHWQHGSSTAAISAVAGAYSPQPPAGLVGYTRYIRARTGGYWVRVTED